MPKTEERKPTTHCPRELAEREGCPYCTNHIAHVTTDGTSTLHKYHSNAGHGFTSMQQWTSALAKQSHDADVAVVTTPKEKH